MLCQVVFVLALDLVFGEGLLGKIFKNKCCIQGAYRKLRLITQRSYLESNPGFRNA